MKHKFRLSNDTIEKFEVLKESNLKLTYINGLKQLIIENKHTSGHRWFESHADANGCLVSDLKTRVQKAHDLLTSERRALEKAIVLPFTPSKEKDKIR